MSTVNRANRKASDADIVMLNSVGLSLGRIGKILGIHPTTVTQRLDSLGIPPANTRRTFMEEIFLSLDIENMEWMTAQMTPEFTVRDFVKKLIVDAHKASKQP